MTMRTTSTATMSNDQEQKRKQKETNRYDNVQQVFLHKQQMGGIQAQVRASLVG